MTIMLSLRNDHYQASEELAGLHTGARSRALMMVTNETVILSSIIEVSVADT